MAGIELSQAEHLQIIDGAPVRHRLCLERQRKLAAHHVGDFQQHNLLIVLQHHIAVNPMAVHHHRQGGAGIAGHFKAQLIPHPFHQNIGRLSFFRQHQRNIFPRQHRRLILHQIGVIDI